MKYSVLLTLVIVSSSALATENQAELVPLLEQAQEQDKPKFYAQCAGAIAAEAEYLRGNGQLEAANQWASSADSWALMSGWAFAKIDELIKANAPRTREYWVVQVESISTVTRNHIGEAYKSNLAAAVKATGQCRQFDELDERLGEFFRDEISKAAS